MIEEDLFRDSCANSCGKTERLQKCAGCSVISYCSKPCQKLHWKSHKPLCASVGKYRDCKSLKNVDKAVIHRFLCKIPDITEEYSSQYKDDKLYARFIECAAKSVQDMLDNNIKNLDPPMESLTTSDFLRRWGYIGPELAAFIDSNVIGSVFESKPYLKYQPHAPQQFRNSPLSEPTKLLNGTTFIEIGFVDFGIIIDSIETLDSDISKGPLNVVGYEMAPLCVAKTMVMLEMMRHRTVPSRSVVEVWLSSLWSERTSTAFRDAVTVVLARSRATYPKEVTVILEYWAAATTTIITKQAAMQFQFENVILKADLHFAMKACNLASEKDRVDFMRIIARRPCTKTLLRYWAVW